jgi:hypothetical protein
MYDPNLSQYMTRRLIEDAKCRVSEDAVLALDLTDINKPYAKKMENLTKIWDGSKKEISSGYWVCEVIAAKVEGEELIPLYSKLYSQEAEDFESENTELLRAIDTVNKGIKGKGIWVIDRGGDRKILITQLVKRGLRFIIRIEGDRTLIWNKGKRDLAKEIAMKIRCDQVYELEIDDEGYKEKKRVWLGKVGVKMPTLDKKFYLIIIKGFGEQPMLLLTNVEGDEKRILEMYLTRWKCEESIRFLKQEYHLEDVRVGRYNSLKNTVVFLMAVFYFLSVYLGKRLKLNILLKKIYEKAKRFFQIPVFKQYALADGIYRILFTSKWGISKKERVESRQLQFDFAKL